MKLKNSLLLVMLGFVLVGFGAGIFSTQYYLLSDWNLISINNLGLVGMSVGFGFVIFALTKLKGQWSFEVVEDEPLG